MNDRRRTSGKIRAAGPRWQRRLGIRLAAGVAIAMLLYAAGLAAIVPVFSRLRDSPPLDGRIGAILQAVALTAFALLFAAAVGIVLARWLTGRVRRFADQVQRMEADDLPGPFRVEGDDEIAFLATAMNDMRDRVEDQLRALNLKDIRRREWIAQVSHDIRTPLTAQLASLDRAGTLIDREDQPLLRNELRELLAVAKMDTDRVHTLADDLLEIARLDAGDGLHLEPVPPGEIVRAAVRSLEPLAAQRGISLDVKVMSKLPTLQADGRRLMRAIENLVRNAIQHARSSVEVLTMLSNHCVRFEVRDDGAGLPKQPDFLEFLRRRSSDKRLTELAKRRTRADSAGLGLVVAQRVAEAHRGVIDAYNLSSGGAAFWLDIPIQEEPQPVSISPPRD